MFKRSLAVLAVAGSVALSAAPSEAAKPARVCPAPFDLMTFEQALVFAHETGVPTPDEELLVVLAGIDRDQDEVLCFKAMPDTPGLPSFFVNVVDNRASVPG